MNVRGLTFEEDVTQRAAPGSIHLEADANWGGDADKQTTSGLMVWAKGDDGMWYVAQAGRQQEAECSRLVDGRRKAHLGPWRGLRDNGDW